MSHFLFLHMLNKGSVDAEDFELIMIHNTNVLFQQVAFIYIIINTMI